VISRQYVFLFLFHLLFYSIAALASLLIYPGFFIGCEQVQLAGLSVGYDTSIITPALTANYTTPMTTTAVQAQFMTSSFLLDYFNSNENDDDRLDASSQTTAAVVAPGARSLQGFTPAVCMSDCDCNAYPFTPVCGADDIK
jgi:hypothetical protein